MSSHEYDKDRKGQQKKRKKTLPKIVSPDKMNLSETDFSDETSLIDKEDGLNDRKDEKNKNMMRIKSQIYQMTLPVLIWRKV